MLIKFWGVHGSLPRPGATTLKFGGNTPCVEVRSGGTLVILDAGSGIRELGEDISRKQEQGTMPKQGIKGHIFFSHLHWDHVQGFPFFAPAFQRGNEFHLYCGTGLHCTIESLMRYQMSEPNFPLRLEDMGASIKCHNIADGQSISVNGVRVLVRKLKHPGGCFGYRIEGEGKILAYATDTEIKGEVDIATIALASKADVLVHDGMFTPQQYHGLEGHFSRESWGHSTWEGAARIALEASVKRLVLFHHGNDDATVAEIELKAREIFPNTTAAYEGLEIEIS
jgi:phosphoribosyl 1,2-cyclic phosphodiesterase